MENNEIKNVAKLSDEEIIRELAYINKQIKFYHSRREEIYKELERRG